MTLKSLKNKEEEVSLPERAPKNQVGVAREKRGRNACSRFLIVDAQSVKNTDTAQQKGKEGLGGFAFAVLQDSWPHRTANPP